jgi:gamma-glutamylcyclotransferase (GGCT)/AIG2-like uncharacterized protein YtfP
VEALSPELYFAYGSNLDAEQMRARCPSARGLDRAALADHRLEFTHYSTRWQGGAADVVPAPGSTVWGVVYEMGPGDFAKLDHFESGYDRIELEVDAPGLGRLRVTSYTVRDKGAFPPHPVYLEKMLRWGARWRLPGVYLAELVRRAA